LTALLRQLSYSRLEKKKKYEKTLDFGRLRV
jgi:hypothetical protein